MKAFWIGKNRWQCSYALAIVIFARYCTQGIAEVSTPAARLVNQSRVLVIAHRGASAHYPENTLPAFQAAGEAAPDLIELDYYHSKDHVPIVFHDKTLDRTTNALEVLGQKEVPVSSLELANLKQLDAGIWFHDRFTGTTIPTLEEALAVIQPCSTTLIERKHGDAATCLQLLNRLALKDRVVVQAFDWQYLKDCFEQDPTLTLGALGSDELSAQRIAEAKATGAKVIGWNFKDLTAANIQLAKQQGLRVWAYTVNESDQAKQLIADGIDGIITDRPALMRSLVDELDQAGSTTAPEQVGN
jgi:glycerophosphoryl diester phosphodiesterase